MQLIFPVSKKGNRLPKISDGWHMRSSGNFHYGVDIMFRKEPGDVLGKPWSTANYIIFPDTAILAAHDGVVEKAEQTGTGGQVTLTGNNILTKYMHLVNIFVKSGQFVKAGTVIGTPGDNPKDSGDPAHLHFELYINGERVDPQPYLEGAIYLNKLVTSFTFLALAGLGIFWIINKGII